MEGRKYRFIKTFYNFAPGVFLGGGRLAQILIISVTDPGFRQGHQLYRGIPTLYSPFFLKKKKTEEMRCVLDGRGWVGGAPMAAHKSQLLDLQNNFNVNFFLVAVQVVFTCILCTSVRV